MNITDIINPFEPLIERAQNDTDLVNQERISLYKDFMICLYQLKENPLLLYYENDTKKKLHDIIPNAKLLSSKKLTVYFQGFFGKIKENLDKYYKEESKISQPLDENSSESDWEYYNHLIYKLREEFKIESGYFEKRIEEFTDLVQKELHIK
jgi:hypothetical protein